MTITDYLFDFSLLFISTCAAMYCWTLSRRLHGLQNLKKGVGGAVANLAKTVTAVEANAEKLNRESLAAVSELRIMLSRIDACEHQVDLLLETMDRQSREAWKEYRHRTEAAHRTLEETQARLAALVAEGQGVARDLKDLIPAQQYVQKAAKQVQPEPTKEVVTPKPTVPAASAPRATIPNSKEMSPREVALAKVLAARRAAKIKRAREGETAEDKAAAADEAITQFQARMRQNRTKGRRDVGNPPKKASA